MCVCVCVWLQTSTGLDQCHWVERSPVIRTGGVGIGVSMNDNVSTEPGRICCRHRWLVNTRRPRSTAQVPELECIVHGLSNVCATHVDGEGQREMPYCTILHRTHMQG